MLEQMRGDRYSESGLLVVNAYFHPQRPGHREPAGFEEPRREDENSYHSLASHDVPAVNSHYKQWRNEDSRNGRSARRFLAADAAIQPLVSTRHQRARSSCGFAL
jgi:hypothetical protein